MLAAAGDERPAQLAAGLGLPLVGQEDAARLVLVYGPAGLELRAPGRRLSPLRVDFEQVGSHGGGDLLRAAVAATEFPYLDALTLSGGPTELRDADPPAAPPGPV